jgi:hypothetical protein
MVMSPRRERSNGVPQRSPGKLCFKTGFGSAEPQKHQRHMTAAVKRRRRSNSRHGEQLEHVHRVVDQVPCANASRATITLAKSSTPVAPEQGKSNSSRAHLDLVCA